MENALLTENQKARIRNIQAIQWTVSTLGSIGGVMYAKNTGGGVLRYIGYFILGGMILGLPAMLITTPFTNKILKEADTAQK